MPRYLSLVLLAVGLAPAIARAQGSADEGREIVALWCAPCHASPARSASSDMAPPLDRIVEMRTRDAINGFLAKPHGRMPDILLSREQIADVMAYMETLRKR